MFPLSCPMCLTHVSKQYYRGCSLQQLRCMAGHSKWQNIKFKKMHKDFARSKIFGKLSLEIITVVRENGPEPSTNSKLASLLLRARDANMPKDNIEKAIKSALRDKGEAQTDSILAARGPGKCALLIKVITPNLIRCRNELMKILKRQNCTLTDNNSILFMFKQKGVVSVEDKYMLEDGEMDNATKEKIDDIAILSEADDYTFGETDSGSRAIKFVCDPSIVSTLHERLATDHKLNVLESSIEYVAHNLSLIENKESADRNSVMEQAHKLITNLSDHPDVINIRDNIKNYPSATCKIEQLV